MTPEQLSLTQNSWLQVLQIAGSAADLFYASYSSLTRSYGSSSQTT